MDSGLRSSREERFSSVLPLERSPDGYNQQGLAHILGRSYDQASATHRTEPSQLGANPGLRHNRIDLSPNSRPLLSQFRLSDHMPVRTLPRSVTGLSDVKYNLHTETNLEKAGPGTHSLTRGLSLNSCSRMESKPGSSAYQQSRTQSLLDLHKPFSPLETRTSMGSQLSLKSFSSQSPDSNSFQQRNNSYNNPMLSSLEGQERSPPYNVFSYQSRQLNTLVNPGSDDKSRTVIVKSTLCYNTSTQTDIPYNESMTDPIIGTPRMKHADAQAIEVTSTKKIERFGRICEEKSVQTSVYRDVRKPDLDVKVSSYLYNNRRHSDAFQHADNIRRYRSSHNDDIKQTDLNLYNSNRKQSDNYIRQFSYEYNPALESSQKNQTRYASHEMLNGAILHRQPSDSAFFNTESARDTQAGEEYHSKRGMFSAVNPATVSSRDPPTSCNTVESLADRCVQSGTDANNNICGHHKSTSDLYNYSDYSSTNGSIDSRYIPSVVPSSTYLGSSSGSRGYSSYTPEARISNSRSSSMTMYDHFGRVTDSAFVTSPVTTDPTMKVHNLSLTSGVGSEISSVYSHPSSPLNTFPDKPFTKSPQSFPHATNHALSSVPGSSTFQWKKIVILNPDHVKGARRDSDSVFLDEDEVEPKFLLYKDFRQKAPQAQAETLPNKLTGHAVFDGGFNHVTSSTDDPFLRHDRNLADQSVPPSPKPRVHRISESSSLGQIQEEFENLNAGTDKGITSRSEKLTPYNGRSNGNGFEKYERELLQNDVLMRRSFDISSSNLQHRKSEPFLESLSTLNNRRSSTDSTTFQRNSREGGNSSAALSAFRNYKRSEHLTSSYSMKSSQDLATFRRESDLQITKQPQQNLQTTHRQGMTSINDGLSYSQSGKRQTDLQYYERDSNSSSETLQDVSSLDNSLSSVRNQSLSETVADLIFKVNENLNKSAQRMGRIRRSSSSSSRNSLDFVDTPRTERSYRRETDWTRIRSLGSLRGSPERDRWPSWSSCASEYLNDDAGILTTSTPRSSFALSKDKDIMLEDSSHNASMDSGLVVSPIYQNFPTKRRPPAPPRPAVGLDTEPPPLPPRMNREKQPPLGGTRTASDQEPTQCPVYGKEKHRIEVIPLGKQQDEEVRVDTSKMNFKDLMMQWKSNSPGENSSSSDLRRHEQKIAEKYHSTGKLVSSVPPTVERTKPNISVASTYRHEPSQKLETTSPVFSSASPISTPQSVGWKSPFSTSPSTSFAAVSEPYSSQYLPSGVQASLNNRISTVYPGLHTVRSSPTNVQPTNSVAYTDYFSNTTESNSGIRMMLANQNSSFSPVQTPPSGRISFLANSRSRSSSDLLSIQLPSNEHPITAEPAPVKLHRFLRDRSSSTQDILYDTSLQNRTQPRHQFRSPQGDTDLAFSKSQSADGGEASALKTPLSPHGEGMLNNCVTHGRLSNSTLTLTSGCEITGDNQGFADESYIGHKNKSSRTVGTYKRSVSAAGVQLTNNPLDKPSADSDSTPYRDSKLGQQSWNSESVLSSTGTGLKTLPKQGSQTEKGHQDGYIKNNQGYITETPHSNVTPVRPPRPNARGRQQAKQSSANPTASSSNVSQKTKLASVSLPALDSLATSSFSIEQGNVSQHDSPLRPGPVTPASSPYSHNQQDHWLTQQVSSSSGTSTASGQVLDRRPEISPQQSHYSPQHRQLALNNSLNSSLSRASLDNAQSQALFIQNSTAKPPSPCSPNVPQQSPNHTPTRDHQRQVIGTARVTTAFNSLEDTPKSSLENSSHHRSGHTVSSPQESKHKSSSAPSLSHLRQPSQEEIECDEKAKELAEELDENDRKLLEVLQQDRVKKRMLYMHGLFSDIADDREKSSFKQKSRASMKNRTLDRVASEAYDSSGSFKSHSLPRDYQQTSPFKAAVSPEMLYGAADSSSDTSPSGVHENLTVMKHKEELVDKLHKKIQVLKDEKLSLQQEIAGNILLGQQVCQVADSRCQTQNEKEKFMTFIDDLEKIVRLLLNLSGQLARAENAVQALAPETDIKLKKMTWDKREKLHAKHEEAKLLKDAVDKRGEQLLCMLQERLTTQELTDYKHFINMKSRLTIQMQEVDDHLALAEQQMTALQRSLPAPAVSFHGKFMEA